MDVAVPLQTVADALNRKPNSQLSTNDETQLATDVVLGFPCPILLPCPALTQVQYAVALRPTAVIVDIGNNDILGAISSGLCFRRKRPRRNFSGISQLRTAP